MIGLSLTSSLRVVEQDRDYWKGCAERDRQRIYDLANRLEPLAKQMQAWITNKNGDITPEQFAQMFYAQDDRWQAAFFNTMQTQVIAWHEAEGTKNYGVPAGEGQWWHVAQHLDDSGRETLTAMHDHATYHERQGA